MSGARWRRLNLEFLTLMKVRSATLATALIALCAFGATSAFAAPPAKKPAAKSAASAPATKTGSTPVTQQAAPSTALTQSQAIGQNIASNFGPMKPFIDGPLLEKGLRAAIAGKDPVMKPERAEAVLNTASQLAAGAALPAGITKADVTEAMAAYYIGPSLNAIKDDVDTDALFKAMQSTLSNGKGAMDDATLRTNLQAFNARHQQAAAARSAKQAEANKAEGAAFLARNKNADGVKTTASGLQYVVVREGDGQRPTATQKVRVHYEGRLLNGAVFDSSYKRNSPAEFGLNQVIKGWTEGVALMPVGSKYRFFVPSELAYGANPRPGGLIGPNAVLVFDVELLAILPN